MAAHNKPPVKKKRRGPYGKIVNEITLVPEADIETNFKTVTATNPITKVFVDALNSEDGASTSHFARITDYEQLHSPGAHTIKNFDNGFPIDVDKTQGLSDEDLIQNREDQDYAESNDDLAYIEDCDPFSNLPDFDTLHTDGIFGQNNVEDQTTDQDDDLLYPGAEVTVGAFMLLLAVFCTNQHLVGDGIQQLLRIIAIALPKDHRLCTTLNEFKNYFRVLKNPLIRHYYCLSCSLDLPDKNITACPNSDCGKRINPRAQKYFLEVPIIGQVKNLFSQKGFYTLLSDRLQRNIPPETYEDIYDGHLYKSYVQNDGPLSYPENISFLFNTDGAPVFKSSKVSIWPIFLVINELPYKMRMLKENMILAALWFGDQKPNMGTFLKPFLDSMKLMANGIKCYSPDIGNFLCKAFLLCGTADLPARCLLCNGIQYNGSYSCWKCIQKGESAKVGKGHAHVYPYNYDFPKGPARTCETVTRDARIVVESRQTPKKQISVNGVKGPSWLLLFPKFNIVSGISIDYMHGVLLGVQKLLLRLWFAKEFLKFDFSYHHLVQKVDSRLVHIQPTLDITRLPRSIETDLKYWKASEFRSFLLYYGAPILNGILSKERFQHYLNLVNAVHILLKCGSTESDLLKSDIMLNDFCKYFAGFYSQCYMTLNIHQLLHLPDCVRAYGPLYTHSCFPFEDKNGFILKLIKGTQNIDDQIVTGVSFVQKLPELKRQCIIEGSKLDDLFTEINSPSNLKRGEKITDGVYILGATKRTILNQDEFNSLGNYLGHVPVNDIIRSFTRIELKGNVIYGLEYSRMIKRNNSTVSYNIDGSELFGQVRCFGKIETGTCNEEIIAFIEQLHCTYYTENSNILAVRTSKDVKVVPLNCIISTCLYVCVHDTKETYICKLPNRLEGD